MGPRRLWILVGVVVAASLGVLAGTRFVSWRGARIMNQRVAGLSRGESTKLRAGQPLPDVKLIAVEGGITDLVSAVRGRSAVVVVISLECAPCIESLLDWHEEGTDVPADPSIIVVCDDPVDRASTWVRETGFRLPLYSDAGHVLSNKYEVTVYPTVIGVQPDGRMVSIRHGIGPAFTPQEALKPLTP